MKTDDREPDNIISNQDVEMLDENKPPDPPVEYVFPVDNVARLPPLPPTPPRIEWDTSSEDTTIPPFPFSNLKIDSEEETQGDDPNTFPDPDGEWKDMYRDLVKIPHQIIPQNMIPTLEQAYEYSEYVNQREEQKENFLSKYRLKSDGSMEVDSLLQRYCQIAPGMYISYVHPMTGHVAMADQEAEVGISEPYVPWFTHPNTNDITNMRARAPDTTLRLSQTQTPIVILDPLRLYRHMVEMGYMEPYSQPYSEIRRRYRNDIHFREAFTAEMVYRFRNNIFSQDASDEEKKCTPTWKCIKNRIYKGLVPTHQCKVQFNKAYFLKVTDKSDDETQIICNRATWHRVNYEKVDPNLLVPYLGIQT